MSGHTFRVEPAGDGEKPGYFLIESGPGLNSRVRLPELPRVENSTAPGADFSVSPGGEWIVATEKLYHGANEVWLLHRETASRYSLVFPSFSRAAFKYNQRRTGRPFHLDYIYITRVGPWNGPGGPIRLTLHGENPPASEQEVDIALSFNLKTRTFSVSPDQETQYS